MATDATTTGEQPEAPPEVVPEQLYTPAPGELQLTVRALVVGCGVGAFVSAFNIYMGLNIGWSIGGSLIAAILGIAVFTLLANAGLLKNPFTPLEANIAQTAGSAAGSMSSAAGLLAPIPALGMLGRDLSYFELLAWAFSVAYLGVFFAVPLRRQMVVVEKLRFPTGTATANTILSMFASGEVAVKKARVLLAWAVFAAVWVLTAQFVPQIEHPPLELLGLSAITAWSISLYLSPMMTGAGLLIGPRVGTSLLIGAVLSWGVLGPIVAAQGWADGAVFDDESGQWSGKLLMDYKSGVRGWILWPGVAIMIGDALTSLALSWRTILSTFMPSSEGDEVNDHAPDQIPSAWWMGGLVVGALATAGVSWAVFDIHPVLTLVAVAMSSVLAAIAVRSTGETDINPIGGMGKVTQIAFSGLAPGAVQTNLMAAAVTGAGASQAGDMMQDLKTGYLLGASPRRQFFAQMLGIAVGILACVPAFMFFDYTYDIGGMNPVEGQKSFPAPAAHAWMAMAELLSKGVEALPPNAGIAVAAGFAFGVAMPVLRKVLGDSPAAKWLPSGLAIGIAFIVPAFYSITMWIGSMALVIWQRMDRQGAESMAFAVASGLIAGEGLMALCVAIYQGGGDLIRDLLGG